jgi:hypothetical protein
MHIGGHERHSRQTANGVCACVWMTVAFAVIGTTGGLRPPLLCCGANVCRRITIFSMHKRVTQKSVSRQPAVGVQTASAMAMRGISVIGFAFREHTTGG